MDSAWVQSAGSVGPREETATSARPGGSAVPDRTAHEAPSVVTRTRSLASVAIGLPTSRARLLPGIVLAGAARCGTTSIWLALCQHPAVFGALSGRKHLNFFDDKYHRGLAWYQAHFPLKARAWAATRAVGLTPVAFEATPDYMYHPLAPGRIARDLPGVRLLVMVRDPVERAYSQHAYQVIDGYETELFERALELEDSRLDGEAERLAADPRYCSHSYQHFGYRARGHYADQLERLAQHVGRNRVHVVDSDEFFADPGPVYDQVIEFLGLQHRGRPAFGRHNSRPRGTPMPAAVRAALAEHFRPHDERLTAWLGHEPSWRR